MSFHQKKGQYFCDGSLAMFVTDINTGNGLPTENTITLKKKFSKIDKKLISQSILEVGHFNTQKKVVFFQNLDFLYRKSYSEFAGVL